MRANIAYIRTRVQNLGAIRRPVRETCLLSLIIDNRYVKLCVPQLYDVPGTLICQMHSMLQGNMYILIIISDYDECATPYVLISPRYAVHTLIYF